MASRTHIRRLLVSATATSVAIAMLTACSAGSATPSSDSVELWYGFTDGAQKDAFERLFVDDYSGDVDLTVKPLDSIDRLTQTALAAGKGPSIVLTNGPSQVASYDDAGYLADLTEYAEKFGWDDIFADWALEASKVDGRLMTIPASYESMGLFYNTEVLDKLGVEPPTNRAEFEEMCERATTAGIVCISTGAAEYPGVSEWHLTFILNHYAGPESVRAALTGEMKWTDPVFVEAIALLNKWFQKGWFGGSVERYFSNTFSTVYSDISTGKAAAMVTGTWDTGSLAGYFSGDEAVGDWDWTALPSLRDEVPADVWALGIGQSMGINAKAENQSAAADYLNFLTTDKAALMQALEEVGFQLPPLVVEESDFPSGVDERFSRVYTELSNAQNIGYTTWTFFPQKTDTYMIDAIQKVFVGSMTPEQFCEGLQEVFEEELAAGAVPPLPEPSAR